MNDKIHFFFVHADTWEQETETEAEKMSQHLMAKERVKQQRALKESNAKDSQSRIELDQRVSSVSRVTAQAYMKPWVPSLPLALHKI